MKKKALLATGVAMSIGLASVAGVGLASAATANSSNTSLVDKIAQKFNLNRDDVQKVFDEDRSEHQAEHQKQVQERLDQAVKDGKITQSQADQIKAKQAEMKTFMESLKDKSEDERHAALKAKMEELKKWATDNNIPKEFARFGPAKARHGGPGTQRSDKQHAPDDAM